MKKALKEKKLFAFLGLFIILLSIFGVSYAYWMLTKYQDDKNVVTSKCFKVTMFKEGTGITLEKAHPISEEEGQNLEGYTFSIENICSTIATYQINLEEIELPTETKRLSGEYIKVSLNGSKGKKLDLFDEVDPTFKKDEEGEGVTTDESHKLTTGKLEPGKTKEFTLKLWISDDTPAKDETMNALFKSKVSIINSYKKDGSNEITVEVTSKNESYSNENETIQITATSELYDLKEYSFDDKEYFPIDQGSQKYTLEKIHDTEGKYTIYFKDIEENKVAKEYETTMLDQKDPEIEVTKEDGKLKIQFQDEKSGLKEYKIDDETEGNWIELNGEKTIEIEYPIKDASTIFISVKDNAGNETSTDCYTQETDSNNPQATITTDLTEWGTKDTINLNLTDDESGIKEITILKDEKEIYHEKLPKALKTYQHKQEVTENGTYQIKVKDLYGNEIINEIEITKIDTTPPEINGNIKTEGKTVTIDLTNSNDNEMGIQYYEYCLNEECITKNDSTHTFENISGNYEIIGRVYDQNNNRSEIKETLLIDPAAKIEETKYATLQNAIDAATENQTITILKNIDEAVEITEDKKIILEVGEYTISSNIKETPTIINRGTLNINNGTITSEITFAINNFGTTNIVNSTIKGKNNSIITRPNSSMTISGDNTHIGGEDELSEKGTGYPTIYVHKNATLDIKDGNVTSINSNAIYSDKDSIVTISDGTFTSETDLAITIYGNTTISGGTITSPVNAIDIKKDAEVTISGETTTIKTNDTQKYETIYIYEGGNLTINNGNISGKNKAAIYVAKNSTLNITGGNITSETTRAITSFGTATISGGTIAGATNTIVVNENSNVTISGENTQIGGKDISSYPTIYVYDGGELNIENGAITSLNSSAIENEKNSMLTIKDGTITSQTNNAITSFGTTNILGGTIAGTTNTIVVKENSNVTISGENTQIGGKDITNGNNTYPTISINTNGKVTIENGNITSKNSATIKTAENATLIISNGNINSEKLNAITNYGTTEILGGTINGKTSTITARTGSKVTISGETTNIGGNDILSEEGTGYPTIFVYENATLDIKGGNVTSINSSAIYSDNATSIITISGGNITSENNMAMDNHGTTTISGGTIRGTNAIEVKKGANVTISGETATIESNENQKKATIYVYTGGNLTINNGNIIGNNGIAIYNYSTTNITGGNITSETTIAINSYGSTTISGGIIKGKSNSITVRKGSNVSISGNNTQIGGADKTGDEGGGYPTIYVYEGGELNVEDSTVTSINSVPIYTQPNSTTNISSGTITSEKTSAIKTYGTTKITGGTITGKSAAIEVKNNSNVTISGGTIKADKNTITTSAGSNVTISGEHTQIGGSDIVSDSGSTSPTIWLDADSIVNIENGIITSNNSSTIYNKASSTVNISGGTITSKKGLAINSYGTTNISGGTITGTTNSIAVRANSNVTISENSTISSDAQSNATIYVYESGNLNVKKGNITSTNHLAIQTTKNSTLTIEGGTINSEKSIAINNYGTMKISGGTITGATNTIILRASSNGTISGNPTIGGNDLAISDGSYPTIYLYENATLDVQNGNIISKNSSAIQATANSTVNISGGIIKAENNSIYNSGNINITNGNIYGTISNDNGKLEIKGGTIEAQDYTTIINYGTTIISGPATITNNSKSYPTIYIATNATYTNNNSGSTITNKGGGKTTNK